MATCNVPVIGNRRTFWTTQACTTEPDCGFECETEYGLQLYCPTNIRCEEHEVGKTRSIRTNDWLKSIIINILFTDGLKIATSCGYAPGSRGGHWSDSYRTSEYPGSSGSNIRNLTTHGSIADALQEIQVIAKHDLQKLVVYGVADSVDVTAKYIGGNTVQMDIIVYGVNGETTNVGLTGKRLKNEWVWST